MTLRRATVLTALLLAPLPIASGCGSKAVEQIETTAAVPVKALTVAPHTIEGIVGSTGVVAPAPGGDWVITAPDTARIVEMPKAEGDQVKTGDLLVRFEIPSLSTELSTRRSEVLQAEARLKNAKASVDRLTPLFEHGVAAHKELEDAQREMADAQAALAQALNATQNATVLEGRTVVHARFPGVIAKRSHNPGDLVSPADAILRVIDPTRLQAVASVAVGDLDRVRVGRPARINAPGGGEPEPAHVLTRPAAVDPAGVTADVRLAFDSRTRLAAGTPVQIDIIAEQHTDVIAVPTDAVVREDENTFVCVAGADGKAHRRKVTLGLTTPKESEVVSGLKAGENVIVQGQQGLPDGAAITVVTQ